jgi:hypothetical protein
MLRKVNHPLRPEMPISCAITRVICRWAFARPVKKKKPAEAGH